MHPLISGLAEGFAVIAPGATRLQKGLSGVARMLSGFPRLFLCCMVGFVGFVDGVGV